MTASAAPVRAPGRPLWPAWLAGLSLAGGLLTPALGCAWGYLFLRLVTDYNNALHSGQPWLVSVWGAGSVLLVLLPIAALAAGGLAFGRLRWVAAPTSRGVALAGMILGGLFTVVVSAPMVLFVALEMQVAAQYP